VQYNDLKGYFMKFTTALIFSISLIVSSHANATLLTDVGGVDTLIASDLITGKSNPESELEWVTTTLKGLNLLGDESITFDEKFEEGQFTWTSVMGQNNIFFMDLEDKSPAYFLLKLGHGSKGKKGSTDSNIKSHLLFHNVGDLQFAVVDLTLAGDIENFTIDRISHVTDFNATPSQPQPSGTPIPEPMTISLFALALLGLARRTRRS